MTVKVKPLVWVDCVFSGQPAFYADTEFGPWAVTAYTGRDGNWAHTDPTGEDSEEDWDLAEDAKAAAQADYEARIHAALEPDQTALTAIELAAYERGVQSALQHILTWMELEAEDRGEADAEYPLERQCAPILALLTQEGR